MFYVLMNEYGIWRNAQLSSIPHQSFYYLETYFFSKVENAAGVKGTSQLLRNNLKGNSD